jgi:hypothetical protein
MAAAVIMVEAAIMVEGVIMVDFMVVLIMVAADIMADFIAAVIGVAVATGAAGDAGIGGTGFGTHTVCNRADFRHNIDRNCWGRLLAVPFFCAAQIIGRVTSRKSSTAAAATGPTGGKSQPAVKGLRRSPTVATLDRAQSVLTTRKPVKLRRSIGSISSR